MHQTSFQFGLIAGNRVSEKPESLNPLEAFGSIRSMAEFSTVSAKVGAG